MQEDRPFAGTVFALGKSLALVVIRELLYAVFDAEQADAIFGWVQAAFTLDDTGVLTSVEVAADYRRLLVTTVSTMGMAMW